MNSKSSLIIHLKPYYGYLIFTEEDRNTVSVYFKKSFNEPFSFIEEIKTEAKTFLETGKLLLESEYIEDDGYVTTKEKSTIKDQETKLIIDLVRILIETATQLETKPYVPFFIRHAMDYTTGISTITKITKERTGILTKKGAEHLKLCLEKRDKISFIELLSISLAIDILSDGTFSARDVIPESLLEKLEISENSTFYVHPSLIKVLRKKFSEKECLGFVDKTGRTDVFFDYLDYNRELEEEPDLSPDKVLELIYFVPQGKVKFPHLKVRLPGALSFSWMLVYVFKTINTIKRELKFLDPWKKKSINLLEVLSFERPRINYLPPELKDNIGKLYARYFHVLNKLDYTLAEKALIATATHVKLLDIINERSLNSTFIRFIVNLLNSGNGKETSYVLERISYLLTCEETFFKRMCFALTTLTEKDVKIIEKFAITVLKSKTPFPKALFAFYPHIEDTPFFEAIVKNVSSKKKEAKLYYNALKTVLFWNSQTSVATKLTRIEKVMEDKLSPKAAACLLRHKIVSQTKLEKVKPFALINNSIRKTYVKAACLYICDAVDFTDMMKECLKKLTGSSWPDNEKYFLTLGKHLGKILDDVEFEVFSELIQDYSKKRYKLSERQIDLILKDENKTWKMLSAVKKIMKKETNF